jgi:hypothetical protein
VTISANAPIQRAECVSQLQALQRPRLKFHSQNATARALASPSLVAEFHAPFRPAFEIKAKYRAGFEGIQNELS